MTAQIIYLNDFRIGSKKSTFKVLLRKNCHNRHVKRKPLFAIRSEFESILDNRQALTKKPALILCTYVHKRKIEMGRNCISRYVQSTPPVKGFRPFGRLAGKRDTVILTLDEYEAIRLLDYEHHTQEEAAVQMRVSRPTLTRIYERPG